jgi:hypothetical protein
MVSSAPTAQVAGYTIVRVLARSPRAILLLAHHHGQPRVLRIVAEGYDAAQLDGEIDARARAGDEHAATVIDLATSDSGAPVVVLEHLSGPRLDELLEGRRDDLSAGEAVTLIVPVLEAVAAAHDRGLTFGGLTAEGIRLRTDGAPVITRFSAARAGAVLPARFRGRAAEYRVDLDSALSLAVDIARHVAAPTGDALLAVLAGDHAVDLDPGFRSTIAALFDCAEPTPVRTAPASALADDAVVRDRGALDPPRVRESGAREPGPHHADVAPRPPEQSRLAPLLHRLALPDSLVQPVLASEARLAALGAAVRVGPRGGVQPRTVALGAAGAVSALLALVLVGAGAPDEGSGATGAPIASASPLSEQRALPEEPMPDREEGGEAPERHLTPEPEHWGDVVGDLVERWLSCRERAAAATCAHASTQPGSSAEAVLHAPGEGSALALRGWLEGARELVVVERMGAAVIVDLVGPETTTASLLLMRNEAGWRLRDVLVEPSEG